MSNSSAPIGVFDSGVGGLTVLKELVRLMPQEDFIYFGDTARVPYGSRPPGQILQFMNEILTFFATQDVKLAVVACNAMTSVGFDTMRKRWPFPLVGMNTGIKTALKATRNKNIGVIATRATIASGKHGKALKLQDPCAAIYPQACPKFVPLIEAEKLNGPEIQSAVEEYLEPLKEAEVDTLILACTHYPFINQTISSYMGPGTVVIDPALETATDAYALLHKTGLVNSQTVGSVRICFSAPSVQTAAATRLAFPDHQYPNEQINLQDFAVIREKNFSKL